ncbi:3545_t:CDS:1, partial [Acaulospora colombiana]
PELTGIVDDEKGEKVTDQEEIKFDEEEDRKIMEEAKRKRLKAKGYRVPPKRPE